MRAKFYTIRELAQLYNICIATLRKRIEPFKEELHTVGTDEDEEAIVVENARSLYSPKQVKIIFKHLGDPTKEI